MRRVVKLSHGHATCTHGVMFSARSGRCRGFSDRVFFCICCGLYHHHGVADRRVQSHDVRKVRGLLACLYQHQASLSPKCEGTVWGSMERLGKALAKDQNVLAECDVEARQWCKETIAGGSNLV